MVGCAHEELGDQAALRGDWVGAFAAYDAALAEDSESEAILVKREHAMAMAVGSRTADARSSARGRDWRRMRDDAEEALSVTGGDGIERTYFEIATWHLDPVCTRAVQVAVHSAMNEAEQMLGATARREAIELLELAGTIDPKCAPEVLQLRQLALQQRSIIDLQAAQACVRHMDWSCAASQANAALARTPENTRAEMISTLATEAVSHARGPSEPTVSHAVIAAIATAEQERALHHDVDALALLRLATEVDPAQETLLRQARATFANAQGPRLWLRNCSACHGKHGQPRSGWRHDVRHDMTTSEWQSGTSDASIREAINTGHTDRRESFRERLASEELEALALYIRSFSPSAAP
jgi:mono/diheme cytochrome c family protein